MKDKFPYWSSFQYSGNNPVTFYDLDGKETTNNEITGTPTNGQNSKPPEDFIEMRFYKHPDKPVGDAKDFETGLSNFEHNLMSLPTNTAASILNLSIDAVNYVAKEVQNPGTSRPLDELTILIDEYVKYIEDDVERFFNQNVGDQVREVYSSFIPPSNYEGALEFLVTKKYRLTKLVFQNSPQVRQQIVLAILLILSKEEMMLQRKKLSQV